MFKGLITALITPFDNNKLIDYVAFEKLIDYQLKNGVNALLVLGTTGEPSTLTDKEDAEVIRFVIEHANKRVPIMVGCGSNSTATALENTARAEKLGADGLLAVTPYYNKCTQNGILEYYKTICKSTKLPVFAYNVPGRTGVNILPATAEKLAGIKNLAGIKEACGNISQILETARRISHKTSLISGDDCLALPIFSLGAVGLISVASNAAPKLVSELVHACLVGDYKKGLELQFKLQPFFDALFSEVSPVPIKYACSLLGLCSATVRPPLVGIEEKNSLLISNVLKELGLL